MAETRVTYRVQNDFWCATRTHRVTHRGITKSRSQRLTRWTSARDTRADAGRVPICRDGRVVQAGESGDRSQRTRNGLSRREGVRWPLVRSRLHAALALALVLALVAAIGSLFGSARQFLGTTSPAASASFPDDDRGDSGAVAVVPEPLLVVGVLFGLALVTLASASPRGPGASEPRRARAPPSR